MTQIYFIRHAEPDYNNHDDYSRPLTKNGELAAELLAETLCGINFTALYSSPYRRTLDTLKPLAERLGLPITEVFDLRERKISDDWIEDFSGYARRQWADFDYKLPNGESLHEVQARNTAALSLIISENVEQTVAIGTHGTALGTIINRYDAVFGYGDFTRYANIFPYVARLDFEGKTCVNIALDD